MECDEPIDLVSGWLDTARQPAVDPAREERVLGLAREMARSMRREGRFFQFIETAQTLNIDAGDLPAVKERLYDLAISKVLEAGAISAKDRVGLRWIARALRLSEDECRGIERRVGVQLFEQQFAFGTSCGSLDADEVSWLHSLAEALGTTARELVLEYLGRHGHDFVERLRESAGDARRIPHDVWQRLLRTLALLGVGEAEVRTLLGPVLTAVSPAEQTSPKATSPDARASAARKARPGGS